MISLPSVQTTASQRAVKYASRMEVINCHHDPEIALAELERLKKKFEHLPCPLYCLCTTATNTQWGRVDQGIEKRSSQVRKVGVLSSTTNRISSNLEMQLDRRIVSIKNGTETIRRISSEIVFTLKRRTAARTNCREMRRTMRSSEISHATRTMIDISHGSVQDIFYELSSSHLLSLQSQPSRTALSTLKDALFEYAVGTEACEWSGRKVPTILQIFSQQIETRGGI